MIITNKTNLDICFRGYCLKPNESRKYYERAVDTLSIDSEIGNVGVITVYSKIYISNYGKLVGKVENEMELVKGTRNIIIECIE